MIYPLLKAVQSQYAESILPPFLGGFFFGKAPEGTTGDYATLAIIGSPRDYATGLQWQDTALQVSLWTWDNSPARILQTARLVTDVFDSATLALEGSCVCLRIDRDNEPMPVPDPDGGWQVIINYTIQTEEAV